MNRLGLVAGVLGLCLGAVGCKKEQPKEPPRREARPAARPAAPTGPTIAATWSGKTVSKPIVKASAKRNGDGEVTVYAYSFDAKDTWPDGAAYANDDFFLDVTIKADTGKKLEVGEYAGKQIAPTLHTKESNVMFLAIRGSIAITVIGGGKLKGEFKLDDGYAKFKGPFDINLE